MCIATVVYRPTDGLPCHQNRESRNISRLTSDLRRAFLPTGMRRPLKLIAVVLNVAICVAGITAASAQEPALGSIAGVVWHDTNVDGVRQADEPGLQIPLSINKPGEQPLVVRSGADGSFEFTDLKAGTISSRRSPPARRLLQPTPQR